MTFAEKLTFALSMIGACAWLPEIIGFIANSRIKMDAAPVDLVHIRNFTLRSAKKDISDPKGQMLILALNFFPHNRNIWIKDFAIEITLKGSNQRPQKAIIGNRVNYYQGETPMRFNFPVETNLHVNHLFVNDDNNIRIIPCLLEGETSENITIHDIRDIKFTYIVGTSLNHSKKILVKCGNNCFSRPHFIEQYAEPRNN